MPESDWKVDAEGVLHVKNSNIDNGRTNQAFPGGKIVPVEGGVEIREANGDALVRMHIGATEGQEQWKKLVDKTK